MCYDNGLYLSFLIQKNSLSIMYKKFFLSFIYFLFGLPVWVFDMYQLHPDHRHRYRDYNQNIRIMAPIPATIINSRCYCIRKDVTYFDRAWVQVQDGTGSRGGDSCAPRKRVLSASDEADKGLVFPIYDVSTLWIRS